MFGKIEIERFRGIKCASIEGLIHIQMKKSVNNQGYWSLEVDAL